MRIADLDFSCALFSNNRSADDEKFLFKHELKAEQTQQFSRNNARDIIACGFKPDRTFIFSDFDYVGYDILVCVILSPF